MLSIEHLNVIFNEGGLDENIALKNISLRIEDGDFVTIVGSNGSGKSTLFNVISGNIKSNSGKIIINGKEINNEKEHERAKYISRLYQNPSLGVSPNLSVIENLAIAYKSQKENIFFSAITKKKKNHFRSVLNDFNKNLVSRLYTKVKLLSGGERQSLSLLMSTINKPKLLLLDEHTAALDPKKQKEIMSLTETIIEKNKITTLMITHSISDALNYGNKLLVLEKGEIIAFYNNIQKKSLSKNDILNLYSL